NRGWMASAPDAGASLLSCACNSPLAVACLSVFLLTSSASGVHGRGADGSDASALGGEKSVGPKTPGAGRPGLAIPVGQATGACSPFRRTRVHLQLRHREDKQVVG